MTRLLQDTLHSYTSSAKLSVLAGAGCSRLTRTKGTHSSATCLAHNITATRRIGVHTSEQILDALISMACFRTVSLLRAVADQAPGKARKRHTAES